MNCRPRRRHDFLTVPTGHGERLVLRLVDTSAVLLDLGLGFDKQNLGTFERLIQRPYGIVLVTGPTGSGKTTTLYAALFPNKQPRNQHPDLQNPVEYQWTAARCRLIRR